MKTWLVSVVWAFAQLITTTQVQAHGNDARDIAAVMQKEFDRPDARLVVEPVVVNGNYAVAGWTQAGKGGRALLQKDQHGWVITVCAGDGLTRADVLQTTGMDATSADRLAKAVVAAESRLSVAKRKLFASFEGVVKVDPAAGHGAHSAPGTHP